MRGGYSGIVEGLFAFYDILFILGDFGVLRGWAVGLWLRDWG